MKEKAKIMVEGGPSLFWWGLGTSKLWWRVEENRGGRTWVDLR